MGGSGVLALRVFSPLAGPRSVSLEWLSRPHPGQNRARLGSALRQLEQRRGEFSCTIPAQHNEPAKADATRATDRSAAQASAKQPLRLQTRQAQRTGHSSPGNGAPASGTRDK